MSREFKHSSARFSDDRVYRYRLGRRWGDNLAIVTWLMLNPSIADEVCLDPTIRRCVGFSESWGWKGKPLFGGIEVVNLFGLVSTNPKKLLVHPDPVGPENDAAIMEAASVSKLIICAFGDLKREAMRQRAVRICRELSRSHELHVLSVTQRG